ncbi:Uncharacterized protein BM_BM412 [Brugia malayi]|uniref:Bm412 n=1 Tax=Brugia malayi TaxID=6279 RepID=A0A0K0JD98_BRUMA|nr:Uncharacterized protein BM_BM412 [Brugia malayi]CDP94691.1 Bm412 [Brugia malayi]VIO86866.1 Uncharacterized protein BM_BM412 [Brugia malayi]
MRSKNGKNKNDVKYHYWSSKVAFSEHLNKRFILKRMNNLSMLFEVTCCEETEQYYVVDGRKQTACSLVIIYTGPPINMEIGPVVEETDRDI